jgi:hypothetical protein
LYLEVEGDIYAVHGSLPVILKDCCLNLKNDLGFAQMTMAQDESALEMAPPLADCNPSTS